MSRISLAEAQARLPELVSRAAAGEEIVIAGEDGVEARLSVPVARDVDAATLAWLESLTIQPVRAEYGMDDTLRRSRDEDWR